MSYSSFIILLENSRIGEQMYTQTKELLALEILKKINEKYQVNTRGSEEFEAFIQEKKLDKQIIENFQTGFSSKESNS